MLSAAAVSWSLCLSNTNAVYAVHVSDTCSWSCFSFCRAICLGCGFAVGTDCSGRGADVTDAPPRSSGSRVVLVQGKLQELLGRREQRRTTSVAASSEICIAASSRCPKGAPAKCNAFGFQLSQRGHCCGSGGRAWVRKE